MSQSEIRKKLEIRIPKNRFENLLSFLNFGLRISDFGFRIST